MEITFKITEPTSLPSLWRVAWFGLLMVAFSSLAGTLLNQLRQQPLPARYIPRAERLAAMTMNSSALGVKSPMTSSSPSEPQVTPVEEITFQRFDELLKVSKPLLVDARTAEVFAQGHAPGSVNLHMETFEQDFQREKPRLTQARGGDVVVYCSGETCGASIMVARSLALYGFRKLYVFKGGWNDWITHKMPVTR